MTASVWGRSFELTRFFLCLDSSLISTFIFLDHTMSALIAGGVEGRRLKVLAWEAGLSLDFC